MSEPRKKKRSKKPKKTVPQDVQTINVGTSSKSRGASSLPREPSTVSMEDVETTEVALSSKEDIQTSNVGPFSEEDFQTIGTFSKSKGTSSFPREPSTVSMEDVEPTEVSSKGDVQTSNVGTFSESKGKSKEIASSLKEAIHTIDKSVSIEDVESIEVSPTSKDRESSSTTLSVDEIKKWKRADVIKFLQDNKEDLDLDDKHIQVIRDQEIAGKAFLLLTEEKLMSIGLKLGPASSIAYLIETLKGGDVTRKRKYEESPEVLTKIVRSAVREEFSRQIPDQISLSNLSQSKMRTIMDDVGLKKITLSEEDFSPIASVSCNPFTWNTELTEDQQMNNVERWFKDVLSLTRGYHVKDVHTDKNYQCHLRGANVTLAGGADISIGASLTPCVWIETKKTAEDFRVGQALGELFIIDKICPTNAMTVLTDCNDHWNIYFFLEEGNKPYIVSCNIRDRGVALAIIKQFVLEEGKFIHGVTGKVVVDTANLPEPEPLKKKTKFDGKYDRREADDEDRMVDMVADMSEQELFNMTVRKRLMLVRDFCKLDEQPHVDQLIRQFSDNYENSPSMMFT